MFLITGGRGAVATHLTRLLLDGGRPVRLGSARPDSLTPPDGVDAVRLDLTDPACFPDALSGVRSVFLYAEPARIDDLIGAAHRAGVEHVVLLSSSSVLGPDAADDPLARSHLDVEKALLASPLTVTILRPGSFASNASAWAWPIRAGRPVSLPFPDAHTDPIHEKDVADAAYAVLTDERHRGDAYTLTGPESLTFAQQLDRLGAVLGRPVPVGHVTRDEWKREMAEYIPGHYADALLNWWESTVDRPVAVTKTVELLTGHPALSFETWAADHAGDFS
ncbi:NAD(P)H-binding protein [Virgisporangium aurantiacum]|uniref:Nucleotide-diphosphate-sugar epimerase n=1 Tax=Virgisporangium aurantiacum TaxID=175570 RepID=A0A8J4E3Y8_9ACTN|nr:NAD(P)H-binding protein [Virgisporangium aurantiacum]GIJ58467.1 nucleotide-diphosphate-sugar epimerase [Virgisporangium aurantiacum]